MNASSLGTRVPQTTAELNADALAVLQPGFVGTTAPDWLRRRLAEGLGSVALFARNVEGPEQVAALTAELRKERPEVLVAIDEEGGDVTRLEARHGSSFPGNLALGAVDDPELTWSVARELGRCLAASGVNLNWAPSADVNSNPDNPVIGVRSFGSDPNLVARHTAAYIEGLQSAGVAACTKHFPGHGDTAVDSHHDLPRIDADADLLHARELVPFRAALAAGSKAVMSAHILLPAVDPALPATLSSAALTGLLRAPESEGGLGYEGLIVTDGIEMNAIAATYGIARGSVLAIAAGADAICVGGGLADEETVLRLRDALVGAVRSGDLSAERLADAAARVRTLAAWTVSARGMGGDDPIGDGPAVGEPEGGGHVALRQGVDGDLPSGDGPAVEELEGGGHVALRLGAKGVDPIGDGPAVGEPDGGGHVALRQGVDGDLPSGDGPAVGQPSDGADVGLAAARRALRVTLAGDAFEPVAQPPLVAAFTPMANIAVGAQTPWGVAAELERLLPGTAVATVRPDDATPERLPAMIANVLGSARDRRIVVVVRDVHRHPWMAAALARLVAARPDAVVVEMGVPQAEPVGALHIATHGAARVCGRAAAEVIVGEGAAVAGRG